MEKLYALAILWSFGFCSKEQFNAVLDDIYLNDKGSDNEILLELEECSNNYEKTLARLIRYFTYETTQLNVDLFGKTLFLQLKTAYESDLFTIKLFGEKCYQIWNILPGYISEKQPFFTLNYAGDPLSWGDELKARSFFELTFSFYEER